MDAMTLDGCSPAPWRMVTEVILANGHWQCMVQDADGRMILLSRHNDEGRADARLAAKAPEMFGILQRLVRLDEDGKPFLDARAVDPEEVDRLVLELRKEEEETELVDKDVEEEFNKEDYTDEGS